jgi:large subunit ribosomal protein L4
MKVSVYNQSGQAVGDIELSDKLFAVKPEQHLMAESVRVQQSNSRVGLAHTKTRGAVSGGGRKPWKQKGTGNARAGSTRSPIWRHGGVTFGPLSSRNWELKLNKKAKTKALAMALTDKAQDSKIFVLDAITLAESKTKQMAAVIVELSKSLKDFGAKHLLVVPSGKSTLVRASRNLAGCTPITASTLNIVEVLKADDVIILKDSIPVLDKTFVKEAKK